MSEPLDPTWNAPQPLYGAFRIRRVGHRYLAEEFEVPFGAWTPCWLTRKRFAGEAEARSWIERKLEGRRYRAGTVIAEFSPSDAPHP